MARNSKPGKNSKETEALLKEQAETDKRNAERHEEMVKEEAEKAKAAQAESDNQTPPIAVVNPAEAERKAAYKKLLEAYAVENPIKYEAKKARGEFDKVPDSFTGTNHLRIS